MWRSAAEQSCCHMFVARIDVQRMRSRSDGPTIRTECRHVVRGLRLARMPMQHPSWTICLLYMDRWIGGRNAMPYIGERQGTSVQDDESTVQLNSPTTYMLWERIGKPQQVLSSTLGATVDATRADPRTDSSRGTCDGHVIKVPTCKHYSQCAACVNSHQLIMVRLRAQDRDGTRSCCLAEESSARSS